MNNFWDWIDRSGTTGDLTLMAVGILLMVAATWWEKRRRKRA